MLAKLISFGYKYGEPKPDKDIAVFDVRSLFRNSHGNKQLRNLSGRDKEVQEEIMKASDFLVKYRYLSQKVISCGSKVVYIGSNDGDRRSVFIVESLGKTLGVETQHRDFKK